MGDSLPDDSLTDQVAQAFCNCTLPKAEWTHEAHLRVGLWHLLRYPPDEAMGYLRDRICQYNTACGVVNSDTSGYHETITQFYVIIISSFLKGQDLFQPLEPQSLEPQPLDQVATQLLKTYGHRDLIFRYYSRERLMTKQARYEWVEPDLLKLP